MNTVRDVGRAGLVAVLVAATVTAVAAKVGEDDPDVVVAQFASAAPLVEGNQVKIDGVVVGSVKSGDFYGIAFPKGSELVPEVNKALAKLKESGEYDAIYTKWFGKKP